MSGDGKGRPVRRPRVIERPVPPPGPLRDLKSLVYELYVAAGAPTLDEIAAWVAADDELAGAPERDTIRRIIRDVAVPAQQADVVAVVTVLARAARWDPGDAAARSRDLWIAARLDTAPGVPLDQVTDPFALEVHRPITVDPDDASGELPLYVRRAHDERLDAVVRRAAGGASAMAVLVAGSSTGKTRACWEALAPLREAGGWRLWHPYDPTRPNAALDGLDRVGPRTVVWLNETQEYLGGEQVAAKLRSLLADSARAPVLVLGTLWPEHHTVLTRTPGSQARQVLEGTTIEVPEYFTGDDLAALAEHAGADPRLAQAAESAADGQITQYLAGGPALLERFRTAPPAAKALIRAAMDARRMGHRDALPQPLLAEAALAYLTDAQCDGLERDWLGRALAYASDTEPCKGARAPLTPVRPDRPRPRPRSGRREGAAAEPGGPVIRLADYLDQHGRADRAGQIPPIGLWTAAAVHAHTADMWSLGNAARDRGLLRDAAQLFKNAADHGHTYAAYFLVDLLHTLHPEDLRPADWAVERVVLDDASGIAALLQLLRKTGAMEQVSALLDRDPAAHVRVDPLHSVSLLSRELLEAGAREQLAVLAARAAAHGPTDEPASVAGLLKDLGRADADEHAVALADRAASGSPTDAPFAVAALLAAMHEAGASAQTVALAVRAAAHTPTEFPYAVGHLVTRLRAVGAHEQADALAARAAAHVPADDPLDRAARADLDDTYGTASLLGGLARLGAREPAMTLASRAAAQTPLRDPLGVGYLLELMRTLGATEHVTTLLSRDPAARVRLTNSYGTRLLFDELREAGAHDQIDALAARSAAECELDEAGYVAHILRFLAARGPHDLVAAVLDREPAAHVSLDDLDGVIELVDALRELDAHDQVDALTARVAAGYDLTSPANVARLLTFLSRLGKNAEIAALLDRRPAAHVRIDEEPGPDADLLDDPPITGLLAALRKLGAPAHVAELTARLPAAGMFDLFAANAEHGERYRFGREPDGSPAPPWSWDDLG
ncbi:hypothetical protein [Actinomadura sediminis]|uniref:Uncharacterized protein n=1 Tax=Actinomadura sediminis TaxID=1038904 RepID=A0ABW3ESB6_9ACTN